MESAGGDKQITHLHNLSNLHSSPSIHTYLHIGIPVPFTLLPNKDMQIKYSGEEPNNNYRKGKISHWCPRTRIDFPIYGYENINQGRKAQIHYTHSYLHNGRSTLKTSIQILISPHKKPYTQSTSRLKTPPHTPH